VGLCISISRRRRRHLGGVCVMLAEGYRRTRGKGCEGEACNYREFVSRYSQCPGLVCGSHFHSMGSL
jgi:hypothetical protein